MSEYEALRILPQGAVLPLGLSGLICVIHKTVKLKGLVRWPSG